MKIPFGWLPSSWGLKGTTREIAEAEYNLKGLELDDRLAEIKYRDADDENSLKLAKLKNRKKHKKLNERQYEEEQARLTLQGADLASKLLHIQWRYGDIDEYQYKVEVAKVMIPAGPDLELELLDIDLDAGKISKLDHAKKSADVKGEPFVCVINSEYNPDDKIDGLYFEFDWNEKWIEELKLAGYQGFTDDQIVQRWFTDICRGVVAENDQLYYQDEAVPFNSSRIIKRQSEPGGPTSYS